MLRVTKLVIARLLKRFAIVAENPGSDTSIGLKNTIYPVTLVDPLLSVTKAQKTTGTATARTDTYSVPAGKKWTLLSANATRDNAGWNDISISVQGAAAVKIGGTSSTNYDLIALGPIPLYHGDSVVIACATGTSGSIITSVVYLEEDLY